jgi:hypothetical protein
MLKSKASKNTCTGLRNWHNFTTYSKKPYFMKAVSDWFETVIDNVQTQQQKSSVYIVVLLVLLVAAGSLMMLLETPA